MPSQKISAPRLPAGFSTPGRPGAAQNQQIKTAGANPSQPVLRHIVRRQMERPENEAMRTPRSGLNAERRLQRASE